jgi:hypothetical protein
MKVTFHLSKADAKEWMKFLIERQATESPESTIQKMKAQFDRKTITELDRASLSVRSQNLLIDAEVKLGREWTYGDITRENLRELRNCGQTSQREIFYWRDEKWLEYFRNHGAPNDTHETAPQTPTESPTA